jgi:hypothetical protein
MSGDHNMNQKAVKTYCGGKPNYVLPDTPRGGQSGGQPDTQDHHSAGWYTGGKHMNPIEQIMALVDVMEPGNGRHRQALRAAIEQALGQGEPVAWQFFDAGAWHNGDDKIKDYRKNTEAAGYITRDLYTAPQPQPKQEQVAWVWNPAREAWEQVRAFGHWQQGAIYAFGPTPPTPQPQREWVGLDEGEVEYPHPPAKPPVYATARNTEAVRRGYEMGGYEKEPGYYSEEQLDEFARAIEAKLREKNGGGV